MGKGSWCCWKQKNWQNQEWIFFCPNGKDRGRTKLNMATAALNALKSIKTPEQVAELTWEDNHYILKNIYETPEEMKAE